jgi:predicted nucleic acid-binding protein
LPNVLLDTNILLPGLVSRGRSRALLTLCRYSAACYVREHHSELISQAQGYGELGNLSAWEEALKMADQEASMLSERLPIGTPDDLYLVVSPPLLNEVRRKLVERFGWPADAAAQGSRSVAAIAVDTVPDFDVDAVDRLSRDRSDDFLIHTAFEGRADFFVTNEKRLLTDGERTEYSTLDGRSFRAHSIDGFASLFETSTFSLEAVPDLFSVRVSDVVLPTQQADLDD